MADDSDSERTLALRQEPKRSEFSAVLNMRLSQTQEEPPKSSASRLINDVAQESRFNPVGLPDDSGNNPSIWLKADKGADVLPRLPVPGEQVELKSGNAASDAVLGKPELKPGCPDSVVLGKEESNLDMNCAVLGNGEKGVSGIGARLEYGETMNNWGNTNEGSLKKCSLKIAVIDETALVDTSDIGKGFRKERKIVKDVNNNEQENGGNREKRPSRRGKSGKNKNLGNDEKGKNLDLGHTDCGIRTTEGFEKKGRKHVYSRKQLEELRHVGLETQRKKWAEIYCGLGPVVQPEYDGLVAYDYHHQYYNQKQKKYIRVDCNGEPSILSEFSWLFCFTFICLC